jgi:hypothetical protein
LLKARTTRAVAARTNPVLERPLKPRHVLAVPHLAAALAVRSKVDVTDDTLACFITLGNGAVSLCLQSVASLNE